MRGAIASEAGKRAGKPPSEVVELVRLVSTADNDLFSSLIAAEIDGDLVLQAAAVVTGMPPAPRLLLRNPVPPADIDAVGIRDAGGVPIGSVQGRTWIAFSDPEAARAAVFSDDVVVCLAVASDLRVARARFDAEHPESAANDTLAMPAVTSDDIERWRRQNAIAGPATELHAPYDARVSDEDLFDHDGAREAVASHQRRRQPALSRLEVAVAVVDRAASTDAIVNDEAVARSLDPERLRLLRLAQLGRLRRFRFERVLGSGAMATVYLARAADGPEQAVSVKVLAPLLRDDVVAVGRFRRELRTLKVLDHPRIVAPIDGDAEDDGAVLWLSCRYLDGGTLADLIARVGPLPAVAAIPLIGAILDGLAHAHSHGVIHRDLKPHNVLLDHDGSICIGDFGIAHALDDDALTQPGARFGTAAYMSPEQATGGVLDERSDLFSAGVLLYHLVSGHNPFVRGSASETMAAVARADVPALPPSVRLPAAAARLLEALLARTVEARPPDAPSALRALQPLLDRLPSVEVVIKRLHADPHAFAGVGLVDSDVDANDRTLAESASTSDEEHSAFGAVIGMRATFEMPLSAPGPAGLAALQENAAITATNYGEGDRDGSTALGDVSAGNEDASSNNDASSDDDDDEGGSGRGIAALIGFTVAGVVGLVLLVLWWFSQRAG